MTDVIAARRESEMLCQRCARVSGENPEVVTLHLSPLCAIIIPYLLLTALLAMLSAVNGSK